MDLSKITILQEVPIEMLNLGLLSNRTEYNADGTYTIFSEVIFPERDYINQNYDPSKSALSSSGVKAVVYIKNKPGVQPPPPPPPPPVTEDPQTPPTTEEPPQPPVVEDPVTPPVVVEDPTTPPVVIEEPQTPPTTEEPPQPPIIDEPVTPPVVIEEPTTPPVTEEPPQPPVVDEPVTPPVVVEDPTTPPVVIEEPQTPPTTEEPPQPPVIEEPTTPPVVVEDPTVPPTTEEPTHEVITFQSHGQKGKIDWNRDGKFGNDHVKDNGVKDAYENYIAVHGDLDNFFKGFGETWKVKSLSKVLNSDNTAKDTDIRENFLSDGTVTLHKIDDQQIGFNITQHDMSQAAPFQYNYVVWNGENKTYTLGMDNNNDGNLTGNEIYGLVQNVNKEAKIASPLIFDTNRNGAVEARHGIGIDIDGNGLSDGAAVNGDKMLAMSDLNGNGKIDGSEVFGNNTINPFTGQKLNAANGFEALSLIAYDLEHETGRDDIIENGIVNIFNFREAMLTRDIKLGFVSDDNNTELEEITDVETVNTDYEEQEQTDADIQHLQTGSYTAADGTALAVNDVWFKTR